MKKKKLILWIVSFILFLGVVCVGYNELSSKYEKENEKTEEKLINNKENINDKSVEGSPNTSQEEKVEAIDFLVYDEEENQVKLLDYKGTPIVLNFWASWCPPCKAEMPYFQELYKKYESDEIKVLMINVTDGQRETIDSAKKFMDDNGYDMTMLFDMDLDASIKYKVSGIPRTIFIDKDGYIVDDNIGMLTETYLNEMVEKIVE